MPAVIVNIANIGPTVMWLTQEEKDLHYPDLPDVSSQYPHPADAILRRTVAEQVMEPLDWNNDKLPRTEAEEYGGNGDDAVL